MVAVNMLILSRLLITTGSDLDVLTASFTITRNHNQLQELTINLQPNPSSSTAEDSVHSRCHSTTLFCPSKSKVLYDWRFTANQFVLVSSPLRPTTRDFLTELLR
jgi:hypothetical protein